MQFGVCTPDTCYMQGPSNRQGGHWSKLLPVCVVWRESRDRQGIQGELMYISFPFARIDRCKLGWEGLLFLGADYYYLDLLFCDCFDFSWLVRFYITWNGYKEPNNIHFCHVYPWIGKFETCRNFPCRVAVRDVGNIGIIDKYQIHE